MAKRMFQILDEMNQRDCESGGRSVSMSDTLIEVQRVKAGGIIKMGVDTQVLGEMINSAMGEGSHIALLLVIDKKEFFKISAE